MLGRQPELSLAELEALGFSVQKLQRRAETLLAEIEGTEVNIERLGGTIKLAVPLEQSPEEFLRNLPEGKITFGISDYSEGASARSVAAESLRLKRKLVQQGRSVRIVENKTGILSSATVLHNGMSGKNPRKVELIKLNGAWFRVTGVQDIEAYARRDQARPARDAKVGMLPPKLAQILLNLCGRLPEGARVLDPFCGTGVVLQEALLMGYRAYGTDISERMVQYAEKNLKWLEETTLLTLSRTGGPPGSESPAAQGPCSRPGPPGNCPEKCQFAPPNGLFRVSLGDATSFHWVPPLDAVACEAYLGQPMSQIPSEMELKSQKQECNAIILGFLKNLAEQIEKNTPVAVAMPAWLRPNGRYQRLENLDEIEQMGYNVNNKSREGLFYFRDGQIVARDIIILRKK